MSVAGATSWQFTLRTLLTVVTVSAVGAAMAGSPRGHVAFFIFAALSVAVLTALACRALVLDRMVGRALLTTTLMAYIALYVASVGPALVVVHKMGGGADPSERLLELVYGSLIWFDELCQGLFQGPGPVNRYVDRREDFGVPTLHRRRCSAFMPHRLERAGGISDLAK